MKKFLVVVDMQKDFVDGSLGTEEAVAIIPDCVRKINEAGGEIFVTYDTHGEDYLNTAEGKKLPVKHCIKGTDGWKLNRDIAAALEGKNYTEIEKNTFGSVNLPGLLKEAAADDDFTVEFIGLCTDICVVSNVLMVKANFPEMNITVDSKCCAGVTPEKHEAALETMRSCQIEII